MKKSKKSEKTAKKSGKRKEGAKRTGGAKPKASSLSPKLTEAQREALLATSPKTFDVSDSHHKTQQALIDRGLAVKDRTGKKLKLTAKGRKVADQAAPV